ncbi:Pogo transposable element with KRAB, partial [Stegodyphus mimosarum]
MSGKRLRSFTVSEKLKILREVELIGNRAARRKYDVSKSCIRDWQKKEELFQRSSGARRAFRGQHAKHPKIKQKLYEYVIEKRARGYGVSTEMCQLKAIQIAREVQREADGTKLPLYVILNYKTLPKGALSLGIIVRAQESGWMVASHFEDWMKSVWDRHPSALLKLPSMLVLGSFLHIGLIQCKKCAKKKGQILWLFRLG